MRSRLINTTCFFLLVTATAFAKGLQFDSIYEPFYSKRIEILWAANTEHLPSEFRVFRRVRKDFPSQVVSNLMALGPFTESDRRKPDSGLIGRSSPWQVYALENASRYLSFRPDTGMAFFGDDSELDGGGEVPDRDRTAELAIEMLDRFGVQKADLYKDENAQGPARYFMEHSGSGFDKSAGKLVHRVFARGVVFTCAINGVQATGLGAGEMRFEFAGSSKLRKVELFDPGLRTVGRFRAATQDQIIQWIREGRARVGSYETTGQRRVNVAEIRKLTIKGVEPAYFFPQVDERGWREIYPYLRLAAEATISETDVEDVYLACPAVSAGLPDALKITGEFAVHPSRLYRNAEGSQE